MWSLCLDECFDEYYKYLIVHTLFGWQDMWFTVSLNMSFINIYTCMHNTCSQLRFCMHNIIFRKKIFWLATTSVPRPMCGLFIWYLGRREYYFSEDHRGWQGVCLWWSREGGPLDCALIDAAGGNTSGGSQGKTGGGPLVIPGDGPRTVSICLWPCDYWYCRELYPVHSRWAKGPVMENDF